MSEQTFSRLVLLPKGCTGIRATNLSACLKSLAVELDRLGQTKVKGIRIESKERKLIVTLEGKDPVERVRPVKRGR